MTTPSISVLSNLRLSGAMVFGTDETDFPANPMIGTMLLKGSSLYAYVNISGMKTWFPLIRSLNQTHIHTQGLAALSWVVTHNFGSTNLWYQVQDSAGNIISPASFEKIDTNSFRLNFTEPQLGTCVAIGTSALDVPTLKTDLIELGANVRIDTSGLYVNGYPVLTGAILNDLVTAQVEQITYTRAEVTQMIADAIAAYQANSYAA